MQLAAQQHDINDSSSMSLTIAVAAIAWCLLEGLFYVWYRRQLSAIQEPRPAPVLSPLERDHILEGIVGSVQRYGWWRQVQGWFQDGARGNPSAIAEDNYVDLLSWAFFYKHPHQLTQEEDRWLRTAAPRIAGDFKFDLRPGRLEEIRCTRHTLDAVQAVHRPLIFYLVRMAIDRVHNLTLRLRGFRRYRQGVVSYWFRDRRPAGGAADGSDTIVFFHGIGIGLVSYVPLLTDLPGQRQFLFEQPWVSMDPFVTPPDSTTFLQGVTDALAHHGVSKCVLVGHSYGSLPAAWVLRRAPHLVHRAVLVDPVCLLLNLPDVCANFLYKKPTSFYGHVLRYLGARELGIARTLCRHFWWTESVLWPSQLPAGSSVILCERDHVLPVKEVYDECMACSGSISVEMLRGVDHGGFLMWPDLVRRVRASLKGPSAGLAASPQEALGTQPLLSPEGEA